MVFSGLKVVELASVLAGPAVGMFFAELGASVVKIENPASGGDMTRSWKLNSEKDDSSVSAYFASVNWGKEHVMLNLKVSADRAKALTYLQEADVVVANFKPGSAEKLGLDAATLRRQNPRLIYGHITGYGPNNHRSAFDVVLQAETGYMSMNGTPQSGPIKMPVAFIDLLAAHQLKEGILIALLQRETTGKGALVEVSLYDAALASLANQASNWLMAGKVPEAIGSQHPNIAPYGDTLETKAGEQLVLAVGTETQFAQLCRVLEKDELVNDPRFNQNENRVLHRNILVQELNSMSLKWPRESLLEALLKAEVPCGAIRRIDEVFAKPEAQSLVLESKQEGTETRRVKTAIFRITASD